MRRQGFNLTDTLSLFYFFTMFQKIATAGPSQSISIEMVLTLAFPPMVQPGAYIRLFPLSLCHLIIMKASNKIKVA